MNRLRLLPATHKIDLQLLRMNKIANIAKHGSVILTAAGVAVGCHNIGQAATRQEKNEIFVETFASTTASTFGGIALGVLFASTPVGWVTALVLGTAAALASYGAGKGLRYAYDVSGTEIDLVKLSHTDAICK